MSLTSENKIVKFFARLPPSTDSWACKWFWAIIISATVVGAIAVSLLPGTAPTVALVICDSLGFYVLGRRRSSNALEGESC